MIADRRVADSDEASWVDQAPEAVRPFLRLARLDRLVGVWLLFIPCVIGLSLARLATGSEWADLWLLVLFLVGSVVMRGAGCTFNDIMDRDIDSHVARTADRPLSAGTVTVPRAFVFLGVQLAIGLVVLLMLPTPAQIMALFAVPLVIAYPFMKRLIDYPQAWLGITFGWGALVGYAAASGGLGLPAFLGFIAMALWTFGYDTLYALEDREYDRALNVGSAAVALGEKWRAAVALSFFAAGVFLWSAVLRGGYIGALEDGRLRLSLTTQTASFGALAFTLAILWTLWRLDDDDAHGGLKAFRLQAPIGLALAGYLWLTPLLT
jgi:4-hydroxybenzoate polyprenyltransferase